MNTKIAFVAYPVSDIAASRAFYDLVLRTSGAEINGEWIEYDLGGTTFVITKADADHPSPVRGALVAFEVADLDSEVARLRSHSDELVGDTFETDICRFRIVAD
ncbi:MAG: VOC family protein [Chthoniobacterales bacterium]|nr:VOC family protein [Chthoniobacterales bacterium]